MKFPLPQLYSRDFTLCEHRRPEEWHHIGGGREHFFDNGKCGCCKKANVRTVKVEGFEPWLCEQCYEGLRKYSMLLTKSGSHDDQYGFRRKSEFREITGEEIKKAILYAKMGGRQAMQEFERAAKLTAIKAGIDYLSQKNEEARSRRLEEDNQQPLQRSAVTSQPKRKDSGDKPKSHILRNIFIAFLIFEAVKIVFYIVICIVIFIEAGGWDAVITNFQLQ